MASPPIPPLLDSLANRPFSFDPPIVNAPPNQWLFRKITWTEVQVVNCTCGEQIWIPRRYVGEASHFEYAVLTVALSRELELKDGLVVPSQRRIIQMPSAPRRESTRRPVPAPVVGIRLERCKRRALKLALLAAAALVTLYAVAFAVNLGLSHPPRERIGAGAPAFP